MLSKNVTLSVTIISLIWRSEQWRQLTSDALSVDGILNVSDVKDKANAFIMFFLYLAAKQELSFSQFSSFVINNASHISQKMLVLYNNFFDFTLHGQKYVDTQTEYMDNQTLHPYN